MDKIKDEMRLFKKDVSICRANSEENEVLRKAETIAEKAYNEDYYTYQVLAEISNLIDNRLEEKIKLDHRVENLELLYSNSMTVMEMNKKELVSEYERLNIKEDILSTIQDDSLNEYRRVILREYRRIYNYWLVK